MAEFRVGGVVQSSPLTAADADHFRRLYQEARSGLDAAMKMLGAYRTRAAGAEDRVFELLAKWTAAEDDRDFYRARVEAAEQEVAATNAALEYLGRRGEAAERDRDDALTLLSVLWRAASNSGDVAPSLLNFIRDRFPDLNGVPSDG